MLHVCCPEIIGHAVRSVGSVHLIVAIHTNGTYVRLAETASIQEANKFIIGLNDNLI